MSRVPQSKRADCLFGTPTPLTVNSSWFARSSSHAQSWMEWRMKRRVSIASPSLSEQRELRFSLVRHLPDAQSQRQMSIMIFAIGIQSDKIRIVKLAICPDASRTRCLRGSFVGFAVVKGDDSFPAVANWKTGKSWYLKPPSGRGPTRRAMLYESDESEPRSEFIISEDFPEFDRVRR